MNFLHILIPIAVGSLIGYCTNYIAIKMLFRPYKAIYIGTHQLPFTPGIIPKNQKRVARAVGEAVNDELLSREAVLSSVGETGEKYISKLADEIMESGRSVRELLPAGTDADQMADSAGSALTEMIMDKADHADIEGVIAQFGRETLAPLLANAPMLAMLFDENMQNMLCTRLGVAARTWVNVHGGDLINQSIVSWMKETADKPVKDIVPESISRDRLEGILKNLLESAISKYGESVLEQIDVQGIVTERIEAMPVDELEKLTMSVMKQELQAVINLGALIGALIGIVNIFF